MKTCSTCKELLEDELFQKHKVGRYGSVCRECRKVYQRNWRAKNIVKSRENAKEWNKENSKKRKIQRTSTTLKRDYGITVEEREKVLEFQKGCCGICKRPLIKGNTDHDHKTGETRGFLCFSCNYALGHFRDNIKLIEAALDYLRNPVVELALGSKRYGLPGRITTTKKCRQMLAKKSGLPLECYRVCCPELLKLKEKA